MSPYIASILEIFLIYKQMWTRPLFLASFAGLNILLWFSYYLMRVSKKDFKLVHSKYHMYMLSAAGLAYIINLIHVAIITEPSRMRVYSQSTASLVQISCIAYYVLQLLFIPSVRFGNGSYVRILLGLCCFPIAYIHTFSIGYEFWLSLLVFLHVFVNDFFLFGFLHDNAISI